jgi:hypothetical protein
MNTQANASFINQAQKSKTTHMRATIDAFAETAAVASSAGVALNWDDYFDSVSSALDTHMPISDYTNIIELGMDTDWLELAKSKHPEYFI